MCKKSKKFWFAAIKNFLLNLNYFSQDKKLEMLREYAEVKIKSVSLEKLANRRKHFHTRPFYWKLHKGFCKVCQIKKVQHLHHIIPLKNGGSNNYFNLISLCETCHSEIHPWMRKDPITAEYNLICRQMKVA